MALKCMQIHPPAPQVSSPKYSLQTHCKEVFCECRAQCLRHLKRRVHHDHMIKTIYWICRVQIQRLISVVQPECKSRLNYLHIFDFWVHHLTLVSHLPSKPLCFLFAVHVSIFFQDRHWPVGLYAYVLEVVYILYSCVGLWMWLLFGQRSSEIWWHWIILYGHCPSVAGPGVCLEVGLAWLPQSNNVNLLRLQANS